MIEYKNILKANQIPYDRVIKQMENNGVKIDRPTLSKIMNDEAMRILYLEQEAVKAIFEVIYSSDIKTPVISRCNGSKYEKQVISLMQDGEIHTREELCNFLNLSDSEVRKEMKVIKIDYPILYSPYKKGYWLSIKGKEQQNKNYVDRVISEHFSKRNISNYQLRPLIAEKCRIKKVIQGSD